MKTLRLLPLYALLCIGMSIDVQAQDPVSDMEQVTGTLTDYIEGTANGEPDRLRKAFHPDFNLYTVTNEDSLRIRSGEQYIFGVKVGKKPIESAGSFS